MARSATPEPQESHLPDGAVAQLDLRANLPLSPLGSGDAHDPGCAEGGEAVHQGYAGVVFAGLAVGLPGHDAVFEALEAEHLGLDATFGVVPGRPLLAARPKHRVARKVSFLSLAAGPSSAGLAEAQGSIVNVASMLSFLADASVPAYGASKTGILGFTRACAHRWGRQGIRVNAIAPGYHRTDMTRPIWSNPAGAAAVEARTALGRWGTAEDLVGATLFLCSPAAAYVTGVCLEVDGGFVSGNPL